MTLPTGNMLKAARALAGLRAAQLATLAKIDASTVSRLEGSGHRAVRGQAGTVDAVIRVLKTRGVEITEDGVRLTRRPHR
jgi:transcriptional regulator with XRE-family HTH domain